MITLITGTPGTGKTAFVLAELLELRKKEPTRLVYVHGIKDLKSLKQGGIAHESVYCKSQLCDIC